MPPRGVARSTPVDPAYGQLTIHKSKWVIPWAEDDPGLTAPELWVNRTLLHARDAQTYNATGLPLIHWRTRAIAPQVRGARCRPRDALCVCEYVRVCLRCQQWDGSVVTPVVL